MEVLITLSDMWNSLFSNPIVGTISDIFFLPLQKQIVDLFTFSGEKVPAWLTSISQYLVNAFSYLIPSSITIFELMFGSGLVFFIAFTAAKWIFAIIK